MIYYATKETMQRYKLKTPEQFQSEIAPLVQAVAQQERGNRMYEWGCKLFYFDRRKCLQVMHFETKLVIFLVDLKMKDQKRYNEEVARTLALENQADDYAMACKIRALIAVIESREEISGSMQQWLSWAKEKADWYDPTVSAEDEFFGKRKHGQSAEEKKPKEMRYYWW